LVVARIISFRIGIGVAPQVPAESTVTVKYVYQSEVSSGAKAALDLPNPVPMRR